MHVTSPKKEDEPMQEQEPQSSWAKLECLEKLKKFVDYPGTRYAIGSILVDVSEKMIVATDVRMLITIPIKECGGTESFLVDPLYLDAMHQMRKSFPKAGPIQARTIGHLVELSFQPCENGEAVRAIHPQPQGRFPKYQDIIPADDSFTFDVLFDARYIHRIAAHALANNDSERTVIRIQLSGPKEVARFTACRETSENPKQVYHLMPLEKK